VDKRIIIAAVVVSGLGGLPILGLIAGIYFLSFGSVTATQRLGAPGDVTRLKARFEGNKRIQLTLRSSYRDNEDCYKMRFRVAFVRNGHEASVYETEYTFDTKDRNSSQPLGRTSDLETVTVPSRGADELIASYTLEPPGCKLEQRDLELQLREPRF
jgi:hypothetical protein